MQLSVIIPTYFPQPYLWECVDSLSKQTLSRDLYEVVIVLNGCFEPYYSSIQQKIKEYEGLSIRLLHTNEAGVSNARNIGLDSTDSDYVCFIDDDDWVSEKYLGSLIEKAEDNVIVASNVLAYNEQTREMTLDYISNAYNKYCGRKRLPLFEGRSFMSSSCAKIIPRQLIGKNRFNSRYANGEDALFMASLSSAVDCVVLAEEQCIYYRRLRTASVSRKRLPITENVVNSFRLCCSYIGLYTSNFPKSNFLFYVSRIVATLIRMVKRL